MDALTPLQIFDETVETYPTKESCASVNGVCVMRTPDGKRCGFSLRLDENHPEFERGMGIRGGVLDWSKNMWAGNRKEAQKKINEMLKPQYRGYNIRFWSMIQSLHDLYLSVDHTEKQIQALRVKFEDFSKFRVKD